MVVKTQDVRTPCYSDIYNIINNYTNTYYLYTLLFAKLYAENVINKAFHKHVVASFTGAWIETGTNDHRRDRISVASFTGAWIETFKIDNNMRLDMSHPLRVRGLKLYYQYSVLLPFCRILYGCVD